MGSVPVSPSGGLEPGGGARRCVVSFPVPLCERRPWWPEFVGMGAGVVSLNKAASDLVLAGLVSSSVPFGHHGGGEEEVEDELGRRQIWVVFFLFSSDDEMQMQMQMQGRQSTSDRAVSSLSIFSLDPVAERRRSPGGSFCGDGEAVSATPATLHPWRFRRVQWFVPGGGEVQSRQRLSWTRSSFFLPVRGLSCKSQELGCIFLFILHPDVRCAFMPI